MGSVEIRPAKRQRRAEGKEDGNRKGFEVSDETAMGLARNNDEARGWSELTRQANVK